MKTPNSNEFDPMAPDAQTVLEHGNAWDDVDPAFDDAARERVLANVERIMDGAPESGAAGRALGSHSLRRPIVWLGLVLGAAAVTASVTFGVHRSDLASSRESANQPSPTSSQTDASSSPPALEASSNGVGTPPAAALPSIDVSSLPTAPTTARSAPSIPSTSEPEKTGGSLDAELRLTTTAKQNLAGHNPAAALLTLDEHERRFPDGQLAQERESLRIQALLASGNRAAAATRARAFRQRYPRGILLPSVERALEEHDE